MAIMATDPKNFKPKILVKTLENFESVGIGKKMLDEITINPMLKAGVKRNNYYILRTDAILRTKKLDRVFANYLHIMRGAIKKGFDMIQINFK